MLGRSREQTTRNGSNPLRCHQHVSSPLESQPYNSNTDSSSPTFPRDLSTHTAGPQERIGRLPHAASASARQISRDTRITIPGEELGNAGALEREALHPVSALINAVRGKDFVKFTSGNYAFTRETMAHTQATRRRVRCLYSQTSVPENVAPPLREHMATSTQGTEYSGTREKKSFNEYPKQWKICLRVYNSHCSSSLQSTKVKHVS